MREIILCVGFMSIVVTYTHTSLMRVSAVPLWPLCRCGPLFVHTRRWYGPVFRRSWTSAEFVFCCLSSVFFYVCTCFVFVRRTVAISGRMSCEVCVGKVTVTFFNAVAHIWESIEIVMFSTSKTHTESAAVVSCRWFSAQSLRDVLHNTE